MLTWIICDSSVAQREKWPTDWMVIACYPINLPIYWMQISSADIYDCRCIGLSMYLFADIYDRVVIACYPINLPIYLMQISIADILIADIYDWMVFACCLINGQYICCWYGIANIYGCHCFGFLLQWIVNISVWWYLWFDRNACCPINVNIGLDW